MKLVNCSKKYKDKCVFSGINYEFIGGIWHLKGANGTGKSVFCRCLLGLEDFDSGEVIGRGKNVLYLPDTALGEDWLSMSENIDLLLYYYNIDMNDDEKFEIMDKLKITEPNKNFSLLSVGTAMKLGMFLLFIKNKWDLIVLDEASSHLDVEVKNIILNELEFRAREGCNIIIVEHGLKTMDSNVWKKIELEKIHGK